MTYGIEPTHPVFRQYSFAEVARVQLAHASRHFNVFKTPNLSPLGTSIWGESGIRTLGSRRTSGFQDRCNKPDSANSPYFRCHSPIMILRVAISRGGIRTHIYLWPLSRIRTYIFHYPLRYSCFEDKADMRGYKIKNPRIIWFGDLVYL